MPIYEYRRPDGSTFEIQQSFSDAPLEADPETGVPVERVLHAPAVHFKGKGFYNTDYGTRHRQRETAAAAEKKSADRRSRATPPPPPPPPSSSSEKKSGGDSKPKDSKAASGRAAEGGVHSAVHEARHRGVLFTF